MGLHRITAVFLGLAAITLAAPQPAKAWGNDGHRQTGLIAEAGLDPETADKVRAILGYDLGVAALWADCAKSVKPSSGGFVYRPQRKSLACAPFETDAEKAAMTAYVARNWKTCGLPRSCHNKYHFANIATGHDRFEARYFGAPPHNIVATINAAILYLQTGQAGPAVSIATRKEALLLLAHLLGDLHQPLHVGAVYLSANGQIQPIRDPESYAATQETQGGNLLFLGAQGLHGYWDQVLSRYGEAADPELLALTVPAPSGPIRGWAEQWANDTFVQSKQAYGPLTYGQQKSFKGPYGPVTGWPAYYQPAVDYSALRRDLQKTQLAKGGRRLAALLNALAAQGTLDA